MELGPESQFPILDELIIIGTGGPCFKTRLRVRVLLFSQTRGKTGFLDYTHTEADPAPPATPPTSCPVVPNTRAFSVGYVLSRLP
ncbi:unnamed protein product [Leuciscus chuanchicus]